MPSPLGSPAGGAPVEITDLSKHYGSAAALRGATLSVRAGEFVSLLGASGSGKSTLLKLIAGLERPTAGRVVLDGINATHLPSERRGIGMVFQDYALFPTMTVQGNIAFPLRARGIGGDEARQRIAAVSEMLGIAALLGRRPSQLSGGQQQRVAIARAIVFEPKIFLLDEPLSALDKNLREQTKGEIKALHRRLGVTIVYVTHDQSEALAMSDRIAVMDHGRIVACDTPQALYRRPTSNFIAQFLGHANLLPVTVLDRSGIACTVDSAWGTLPLRAENVALPPADGRGARGLAVIRPEHLRIVDGPVGGNAPCVTTTVTQALYNGSETIYRATCRASRLSLMLIDKQTDGRIHDIGANIHVEVDPAQLVLVPEAGGAA
jgi:putative spermidine/putrescine transport system ATP-binding protein